MHRLICFEILNYLEKFTVDDFSGLNEINKCIQDAFWGYKTPSKV